MKDLIIIGGGDFGREVAWLVSRINEIEPCWNFLGFVDDGRSKGDTVDGAVVLGDVEWLSDYTEDVYVTCAIGTGAVREKIWKRLSGNDKLHLATLIDPSVILGCGCQVGEGTIICAGTVVAIAVSFGKNCIVNFNCSLGHDAELEDYCTMHPGANISGRVHLESCCDLGTGSIVIPGKRVAAYSVLGAGTVVVKDLTESGTYVGSPAKKIK